MRPAANMTMTLERPVPDDVGIELATVGSAMISSQALDEPKDVTEANQAYACKPDRRKFTPQKQKITIKNPNIAYTAARWPSHPRVILA